MLARMDFQAHWPGTLQERVVSAVGQLVPPLHVTHAEYIVLHELPDMMSLLLAEISVVYAHAIQGRHYYQSAHSCSGMVNMPGAEACDDGVDACGFCLVEFDAGDGEAVAAVRCCRKRVHTRCFQQYLASATLVNETRMPCLYCRQCLGCLLPNGH